MGCGNSNFSTVCEGDNFHEWLAQFKAVGLNKRKVKQLYSLFCTIDKYQGGKIGLNELLAYVDVERTGFTTRIFRILSKDHNSELDFRQFVISLWNYCTLSGEMLDSFLYRLYSDEHCGKLKASGVVQMVKDIHGLQYKARSNAKALYEELTKLEINEVIFDLAAFKLFLSSHRAVLSPAFQVQQKLRSNTLSKSFWRKCAQSRNCMWSEEAKSMLDLIEIELDERRRQAGDLLCAEAQLQTDKDIAKRNGSAGNTNIEDSLANLATCKKAANVAGSPMRSPYRMSGVAIGGKTSPVEHKVHNPAGRKINFIPHDATSPYNTPRGGNEFHEFVTSPSRSPVRSTTGVSVSASFKPQPAKLKGRNSPRREPDINSGNGRVAFLGNSPHSSPRRTPTTSPRLNSSSERKSSPLHSPRYSGIASRSGPDLNALREDRIGFNNPHRIDSHNVRNSPTNSPINSPRGDCGVLQ